MAGEKLSFDIKSAQSDVWEILDRIIKKDRIGSAYLFAGQAGVGKEAMSIEFGAEINKHYFKNDKQLADSNYLLFKSLQHELLKMVLALPATSSNREGVNPLDSLSLDDQEYLTNSIEKKVKDPFHKIIIPGATRILEVDVLKDFKAKQTIFGKTHFMWPLKGPITSKFGLRGGLRHNGIDIDAKTGDPFKAADNGTVDYTGDMRGYGNVIIIKHDNGYFTVYAHNKKNLVKLKQRVRKGQVIGLVGKSGRTSGSHLHFEIRRGEQPVNPLTYLPHKP